MSITTTRPPSRLATHRTKRKSNETLAETLTLPPVQSRSRARSVAKVRQDFRREVPVGLDGRPGVEWRALTAPRAAKKGTTYGFS